MWEVGPFSLVYASPTAAVKSYFDNLISVTYNLQNCMFPEQFKVNLVLSDLKETAMDLTLRNMNIKKQDLIL
jgi:hypothetical protein